MIEVPADALPPPPLGPPFEAPPLEPPERPPLHVASAKTRFGAFLLDFVILGGSLGLGWAVWAVATVRSARCPGKHVLHLRLVDVATGQRARWYYTATREIVLKLPILAALLIAAKAVTGSGNTAAVAVAFVVLGLAAVSSAGSISNGRSMFDLLVGTVVVDERGEPPVPEQLALPFSDLAVAGTEPL